MLDSSEFIAKYDQHDALGVIAGQPDQLLQAYGELDLPSADGLSSIVLTGMGGSALDAEFVKNWLGDRLKLPFEIIRGYELPAFVGKDTLVIASSYSGNTEETVSALADAEARGARIIVIASGGKLIEAAKTRGHAHVRTLPEGHPHFDLPAGLQPRLAVLYGVKALVSLIEHLGLLTGLSDELQAASAWVKTKQPAWQAASPMADNPAKRIATALHGHPVVVYGGPTLSLPTMKWKIDINENSKQLAFYNNFSELDHNEFNGWSHPVPNNFRVVELRSDLDHPQIQKRFDVTNKLLADRFAPIEVVADGETKLQQMLYTLLLGDYVSAYLAFLNEIDPTPVDLIEELKRELA
ncbi:bifunctional phosphoglucose/phosphomannose isomerase [Candidatus Saccharibacteria bacterium]|nr:bifunctional phosphoglucose/phosphomannose isomerase [Candidatus Saccharibacteria bacterium]